MDSLDLQFRVATSEELEANNDHCAICWEEMNAARYNCFMCDHVMCDHVMCDHVMVVSKL